MSATPGNSSRAPSRIRFRKRRRDAGGARSTQAVHQVTAFLASATSEEVYKRRRNMLLLIEKCASGSTGRSATLDRLSQQDIRLALNEWFSFTAGDAPSNPEDTDRIGKYEASSATLSNEERQEEEQQRSPEPYKCPQPATPSRSGRSSNLSLPAGSWGESQACSKSHEVEEKYERNNQWRPPIVERLANDPSSRTRLGFSALMGVMQGSGLASIAESPSENEVDAIDEEHHDTTDVEAGVVWRTPPLIVQVPASRIKFDMDDNVATHLFGRKTGERCAQFAMRYPNTFVCIVICVRMFFIGFRAIRDPPRVLSNVVSPTLVVAITAAVAVLFSSAQWDVLRAVYTSSSHAPFFMVIALVGGFLSTTLQGFDASESDGIKVALDAASIFRAIGLPRLFLLSADAFHPALRSVIYKYLAPCIGFNSIAKTFGGDLNYILTGKFGTIWFKRSSVSYFLMHGDATVITIAILSAWCNVAYTYATVLATLAGWSSRPRFAFLYAKISATFGNDVSGGSAVSFEQSVERLRRRKKKRRKTSVAPTTSSHAADVKMSVDLYH
eukprot:CAMPEP_0118851044 /NCGR_PEP_ID=MMETSP1163-20130328/630_1 /TAXON_ID=124430 /ORGANISM="Phaeomonas parva, Strain CCMP2877" /LENGTH=555 /DNA_ID=CAMNT_0006783307 /DNA_START=330 /DNA_END=1997 /DNA_ORIENTATION=+